MYGTFTSRGKMSCLANFCCAYKVNIYQLYFTDIAAQYTVTVYNMYLMLLSENRQRL